MSKTTLIPYVKWSEYPSQNQSDPDVLSLEVLELDTFESEYSRNVRVSVDGEEKYLQLQKFDSSNQQLLKFWQHYRRNGKLQIGTKCNLLTWMGKSKKNPEHNIRRFKFTF